MHRLATICVAIAACRVGVGSHAAPSRSIPKSPRSLLGVPTKRHLRSDKLTLDEEERAFDFDLNVIPPVERADEVMGKTAELSGMETEDREQLVKLVASEEKKKEQLKFLKEREQLVKSAVSEEKKKEHFELLNDWKQTLKSFEHEVQKAKSGEFKALLIRRDNQLKAFADDRKENLKELRNGWEPAAEMVESKSKSTTEGLQAWLEKEEPRDSLFKVLGIHKAMDKTVNTLLISMNLERWNFVMKSLDKTGHYNFEDELQKALMTFCRNDENRAKLFLKRLVILRQQTSSAESNWLHEKQEPKRFYELMKLSIDDFLNPYPHELRKLQRWSIYVDAYNDLHPEHHTTLIAELPYSEVDLVNMLFGNRKNYPRSGSLQKRMLDEILMSWADEGSPVSDVDAFLRLGLLPSNYGNERRRFHAWEAFLKLTNEGKQVYDVLSAVLKELAERAGQAGKGKLHAPVNIIQVEKNNPSKRKPESLTEDARDWQRPRGGE